MVTKVSTNDFFYSASFAPNEVSGLTISHSGGAVAGVGAIVETVAGNISVPANTIWTVYLSLLSGTMVAAATSAVPTTDAVSIWRGVSDGSSTTFEDIRSWMNSGLNLLTTAETLIADLSPVIWFKCDEGSGLLQNSGSGAGWDMTLKQGTPTYQITGGDQSSPSLAVTFTKSTNDAFLAAVATSTFEGLDSSTTGAIIMMFRSRATTNGTYVQWSDLLDTGFRNFTIDYTSGKMRFENAGNGSIAWGGSTTSLVNDDVWHVVVCNHDGVNASLWVDGVNELPIVLGSEQARWFSGDPPSTRTDAFSFSGGAFNNESGTSGVQPFDLDHFIVVDGDLTDQQIIDLTDSYLGL